MKKIEDAVRDLCGAWPSDDADAVYLYRIDDRYIAGLPGGTALHICTRTEFEECTRRLRPEDEKVESKDDWYNRGQRPPVGTICEMTHPGLPGWLTVEILLYRDSALAPSGKAVVVCAESEEEWPMGVAAININKQLDFRPLRTEREQWVDAATKAAVGSLNHAEFLGRLYDAGLAKMPEGK